eukprot:g3685.t2
MELEVARHSGIPESSILSVRIGSTRRLVHLNQLERPMKFPLRPEDGSRLGGMNASKILECTSIKVDVMDLSGTARVACQAKTTEYTIPLETTDEVPSATGMEVTVKLKPQGADSAAIDEDHGELEKKKEDAAKAYLEKHGLTSFMQFLIQSLMKDKPSDPYAFMQRQVTKRVVAFSSASQARGTETDKQLDDILQKLSAEVSESVPAEQLQSLQEQAEAAGAQLRKDNEELRGMLEMLKTRYKVLLQENTELAKQVGEDPSGVDLISMKDWAMTEALSLLLKADDVGGLVNENALLVSELTSMRKKIETMKGQDTGLLNGNFDHVVGVRERLLAANVNAFGGKTLGENTWTYRFVATWWTPMGISGFVSFLDEIFEAMNSSQEVRQKVTKQVSTMGCLLNQQQAVRASDCLAEDNKM